MTVPRSLPCSSRSISPSPRSLPMVRTTPGRSTEPSMSEAKVERCVSSSNLEVTPSSARGLRPHFGKEIATFARSDNSAGAGGTRTRATANAAWSRIPCTDTRRSSVEVCEVEPPMDNELRYNGRARSSNDDPSRDARQIPSGVIHLSRVGVLPSAPSHDQRLTWEVCEPGATAWRAAHSPGRSRCPPPHASITY